MDSSDLARFAKNVVRPLLGSDYFVYARRDLVRMRGPFFQGVLFAKKRSGWLVVIPVFYVLGASQSDDVLFQTMSLPVSGVDEYGIWRWSPDVCLGEVLAEGVVAQIERESPLSFFQSLEDERIDAALNYFSSRVDHWAPSLSRAYFNMCRGRAGAHGELLAARKKFIELSRIGRGGLPTDFESGLLSRIETLLLRFEQTNCIELCRRDVEEHANRLSLGDVKWPVEWPESLPVEAWKEGPRLSWTDRLFGRF